MEKRFITLWYNREEILGGESLKYFEIAIQLYLSHIAKLFLIDFLSCYVYIYLYVYETRRYLHGKVLRGRFIQRR